MAYKIRPSSVGFNTVDIRHGPVPIVYWEVYEEGVYSSSIGGMSLQTKPERVIARNVTKGQAREILKEILSEG